MRPLLLVIFLSCSSAGLAAAQDDVGAAQEGVCCGGTCCLIEGVCHGTGEVNPLNSCQSCTPLQSQTEWTTEAGCVPDTRDAGGGGGGGGGCSIGAGAAAAVPLLGALIALGFFVIRRRR